MTSREAYDFRELLKKYMRFVGEMEGTDFTDSIECVPEGSTEGFTDDDKRELMQAAREMHAERKEQRNKAQESHSDERDQT